MNYHHFLALALLLGGILIGHFLPRKERISEIWNIKDLPEGMIYEFECQTPITPSRDHVWVLLGATLNVGSRRFLLRLSFPLSCAPGSFLERKGDNLVPW